MVVRRELTIRGWAATDLWNLMSDRHGGTTHLHQKRARRWLDQDDALVPVDAADLVLTALGLNLTDVDIHEDAVDAPRRRGGGKPAGVYGYLTDAQLRACHRLYETGVSLRGVAAHILPRTRYRSVKSCSMGLQQGFARLGLPVRDRVAATVAASTTHGLAPRHGGDPGHRHMMRVRRGEIHDQPMCAATRLNPPGAGRPCRNRAMVGGRYCAQHDPGRAEVTRRIVAHARAVYREAAA